MEVDSTLIEGFKNLSKEDKEFTTKCAQIIIDVNSGRLSIVQLVEQLGTLLVDVSPNNRELGTWILTRVLEGLPLNHFNQEQLKFICSFYADRLKDHHQVIPAVLTGILALARFEKFPNGSVTHILTALFQNIPCQQQQEQDRHNIYKIFAIFLDKYETELCAMKFDYIYGVISAIDGERSPKNLMLLFNWFPKFLKTVTLGHLSEEAFEVMACYFPVDFRAPTQDPVPITREQLAEALAPCLTAIPEFAEFCLPVALEKLESSLEVAKVDALKLLEIGCLAFDEEFYVQNCTQIWSHIQKEIFSNPNANIETAGLTTLTALIKKISNNERINDTVKDISDTVKGNLLPDSTLFGASSKLLLSVAAASKISCDIISKEIVPIYINTFNITTTVKYKVKVFENLVDIFECYVTFYNQIEFEEMNKIPILCLKTTSDQSDELKKVAYSSLSKLARFLPTQVRMSLYDNFKKLLHMPQKEHVKYSILDCFKNLAKHYPSEIKNILDNDSEITEEEILENYLGALCGITSQEYFTGTIVDILFNYLGKKLNLSETVIKSLQKMMKEYEGHESVLSTFYEKNTISVTIDWTLSHEQFLSIECLENVAFILKTIIGRRKVEDQKNILQTELPKIKTTNSKLIFVLDGLLCRLRKDVEIDYKIFNDLTNLITNEGEGAVKSTAVQLLANLLNKCHNDDALSTYFAQFNDTKLDITLVAWITKALVMRNHTLANYWTDKLLEALETDNNVAIYFRIIISNQCDSLSPKSYCVKAVLYEQKFFTVATNKFIENYQSGYHSYLLAFGYLLENAPKQVILLQFQKVLKLIILCLDDCKDGNILTVILQVVREFIINKEKCIEDHLTDFLTRFFTLSTLNESLNVRILALQCLRDCTFSFPVYKLLVHRQEALAALGKAIDDKKRTVRKEAVDARMRWFLLDAPE